jgi:hypothetical protein
VLIGLSDDDPFGDDKSLSDVDYQEELFMEDFNEYNDNRDNLLDHEKFLEEEKQKGEIKNFIYLFAYFFFPSLLINY